MVIAGVTDYSPMRVGAASVAFGRPSYASGMGTMVTGSPPPSAPKPVTTDAENTLPPVSANPLGVSEAGPSAPVVAPPAPPAPPAAPGPPAPAVAPAASAPVGKVAVPSAPAPGAPVAQTASVPAVPAPASASSPKAAFATTGGPAPLVARPVVDPPAPATLPAAQVLQPSRPQSPDRRPSRPHSPAPQQERESTRRRRNSPRRYQQQAQWPALHGGHGGWRGPRGRGGGGAFRPRVTMADLQREVSRAAVPPVDLPPAAVFPPPVLAPSPCAPTASLAASGSRLRLPPVPPVAGVEFVAAGGGAAGAQHTPYPADDEPLPFLAVALQPPQTRVPETTLGQLHCLAESLHALLLIQVLAYASLPVIPADSFRDRPRETCLDAADQLVQLLAPALAAPAEGGTAAVGQLDEAVRGLRRHLRAGSGAAAIGASTLVVRELWRTLTGILHALGAHRT
ncbi:unnamed protein product [Closterium sp. Naga37s-1]|nr:unnamed protein product [Closterium sp. Naga37s-1]